jgi:hypothetical protein
MFYFRAYFRCSECAKTLIRIVKIRVRSKFDARDKIGIIKCHLCISKESLEFIKMEELELSHLEEFIQWTGESKISNTTLDILSTR